MDALQELGKAEVISVLIEGGGTILGEALDTQVADEIQIYLAPLFTGGPIFAFGGKGAGATSEAVRLRETTYARVGRDICVTGLVAKENSFTEQFEKPLRGTRV